MEQSNLEELAAVTLTPYIQRATALIGVPRKIGGNQFRHMMATLGILVDYKIVDSIILKASVIHDLLEDIPETDQQIILNADVEGSEVLTIVRELTRRPDESKTDYLIRIRDEASFKSKIIKLADRISNLTDINTDIFDYEFISRYIDETEKYLLPMAKEINENMYNELYDLIVRKKKLITNLWQMQNILKNLFTKNNKKNH
jgi:GTP pyrophosphokinase